MKAKNCHHNTTTSMNTQKYGNSKTVIPQTKSVYDDGNIPEVDLKNFSSSAEPLPESSRPRKDGPGGE